MTHMEDVLRPPALVAVATLAATMITMTSTMTAAVAAAERSITTTRVRAPVLRKVCAAS